MGDAPPKVFCFAFVVCVLYVLLYFSVCVNPDMFAERWSNKKNRKTEEKINLGLEGAQDLMQSSDSLVSSQLLE